MASPTNNNNNFSAPPNHQGPSWTPEVVEQLIFRQFLKGEDVSKSIPLSVADQNRQRLPELDASIRALQKYCETGPSVPTNTANNAGGLNMMNNNNVGTNLHQQQTGNSRSQTTPMKNRPPLANNGQQQQQQNQQNQNGSATPRTGQKQNQQNSAQKPRTPRGEANNNNNNNNNVDNTKRRRFEWPVLVPTDAQLKGNSRSQLQPLTEKRIQAQAEVDPDLIFRQDTTVEFPLTQIFAGHSNALKLITQTRGLSGDWRQDTFSAPEEAQYKADMGFSVVGPSQAKIQANVTLF